MATISCVFFFIIILPSELKKKLGLIILLYVTQLLLPLDQYKLI